MNTVTLWLLISIGAGWDTTGAQPTQVVERFATSEECQRVADLIRNSRTRAIPVLRCIEAKVARP